MTNTTLYEFSYDTSGYLTTIKDMDGLSTYIVRHIGLSSVSDTIYSETNPDSIIFIYSSGNDSLGSHIAVIGPFGQRTILKSNVFGYTSSIINPNGDDIFFNYTASGLMTGYLDAKENPHQFTYDISGKLVLDEDPAGGFTALDLNDFQNGTEITKTSAEGKSTTYRTESTFDGSIKMTNTFENGLQNISKQGSSGIDSLWRPDGTVITSESGPDPRFGLQAPITKQKSISMPSGLTMNIQNRRTISEMTGLEVTGLIDSVILNGRASASAYDGNQNLFTNTSPTGRRTFSYTNDLGRVVKDSIPSLLPIYYTYNDSGFLVQTRQGDRISEFSYDNLGRLQTVSDPMGRIDSLYYDSANRLTRQTLPDGNEILYDYDANGNITSITPPGKPAHTFSYTPVDLTDNYMPPTTPDSSGSTHYFYNLDRQIVRTLFPDSAMIDVVYDTAGCGCGGGDRPAKILFDRGEIAMQYDSTTGNLVQITSPGNENLNYTYDGSLPLSVQSSGSVNGTISVTYNNDFQVTSQSINGANTINYDYDDDGLLTQAGQLNLSYNNLNGMLEGATLGNVTTDYTYNEYGEMTGYTAKYNSSTIFQTSYQLDDLGRITDLHEISDGDSNSYHYEYDLVGQLKEVRKNDTLISAYTYDSNGNRLSHITATDTTYGVYDEQDRLLSYGQIHYGYTANGSLRYKAEGLDTTWYTYDLLGNLTEVLLPNGDHIEYVIDGNNRRIAKKKNGVITKKWLYQDQLNPVAELNENNQIVARYFYGLRSNVPDFMWKGGGYYRIISDHLSSVRLVIKTDGTIAQRLSYDAFGNVLQNTSPGLQSFGFAGGLYDEDTKLVRFGARDYDAEIGRWTAKEPLGFAGGNNFYIYCYNNPVNLVDIFGLQAKLPPIPIPGYLFAKLTMYIYEKAREIRIEATNRYPGVINSDQRHEWASYTMTKEFGGPIARMVGLSNEIIGYYRWDIPRLGSRLRGESTWAFQLRDLMANERGIYKAEQELRNEKKCK
ncbi:MAG: RHS repeat-associated core domain-containing protein [Calditrichaceae bacterium]|nr:RHS repeat-associated core domain-containing protein [Calditrichaceae bacterium]